VGSIFKRTDVLGFQQLEYERTPDAIDLGLGAALPASLDLGIQIGGFGRGERGSGEPMRVSVALEASRRRAAG
jgi:hypothetical protein